MNVAGTWKGTYAYDPATGWAPVEFGMELEADRSGKIHGIVQDGAGGHPMPGRIDGRIGNGGALEFVKTMPATLWMFPDGRSAEDRSRIQRITYRGTFDGPNSLQGTWTVRGRVLWNGGSIVVTKTSHGTWRMWRVVP